jgi:hypothetical protein
MEKMTSMDKFKDIDEVEKRITNLGLELITLVKPVMSLMDIRIRKLRKRSQGISMVIKNK